VKDAENRSRSALKAWQTRRTATYRAAKAEARSKQALREWAKSAGFHLVLLDAPSGRPRTGIIDALLIRNARENADALEVFAVQLKGGGSGMTPREMSRLNVAADQVRAFPLVVLHDGTQLHFLPAEPVRRTRRKGRAG
jgi:hypothetical protein